MIISVTELEMAKRCLWRWDKMSFNREGLTPIVLKQTLDQGILVHRVLEAWIKEPDADPTVLCEQQSEIMLLELAQSYKKAVGTGISKSEMAPLLESIRVVKGMIANYQAYYTTPLPQGWTLISAEQACLVKIPGTKHQCNNYTYENSDICECNRCNDIYPEVCDATDCECCCWHQLEGTLDALVANERGDIWVKENKTWDKHPSLRMLARTPQFGRYVWITQQLGLSAYGIAYDGLWTRALVPNGRKFEELFMRIMLPMNQHFIDELATDLAHDVNWIASHPHITKSYDWTCGMCGVYDLCEADAFEEDYNMILQTKYHKRERTVAFNETIQV